MQLELAKRAQIVCARALHFLSFLGRARTLAYIFRSACFWLGLCRIGQKKTQIKNKFKFMCLNLLLFKLFWLDPPSLTHFTSSSQDQYISFFVLEKLWPITFGKLVLYPPTGETFGVCSGIWWKLKTLCCVIFMAIKSTKIRIFCTGSLTPISTFLTPVNCFSSLLFHLLVWYNLSLKTKKLW